MCDSIFSILLTQIIQNLQISRTTWDYVLIFLLSVLSLCCFVIAKIKHLQQTSCFSHLLPARLNVPCRVTYCWLQLGTVTNVQVVPISVALQDYTLVNLQFKLNTFAKNFNSALLCDWGYLKRILTSLWWYVSSPNIIWTQLEWKCLGDVTEVGVTSA
jgi:hypothetical protein